MKKESSTSHSSLLTPHRWLITGGCGFIGTSLVKHLVSQEGHFIRIVDNLSVGTREDLAKVCNFTEKNSSLFTSPRLPHEIRRPFHRGEIHANEEQSGFHRVPHSSLLTPHSSLNPSVELIVADILDADLALKTSHDMDLIVHLAASTGVDTSVEDPRHDMEANVIGTLNYLEAARINNVGTFIFASSGAPIGECEPPFHEEIAPHPVSPYGASKLAGEAYCSAYYQTFGINTVTLRFGNVYGPGSSHKNSIVAKFIKQAKNGEICEIYGDGTQTRDFIYIDDLISAIYKAATIQTASTLSLPSEIHDNEEQSGFHRGPHSLVLTPNSIWGEIFQIATSKEHTINEVAELLKNELQNRYHVDMKIKYREPRVGDVKRNFSDTSKALERLGWRAEVELSEGIRKTIEWFLKTDS